MNSVKVKVDGVGFKCKQDVPTVHSELAALVAEMCKDANSGGKHDTKTLLYQTRNHDKVEDQLPVVHVDEPHILQDWFDTHLE